MSFDVVIEATDKFVPFWQESLAQGPRAAYSIEMTTNSPTLLLKKLRQTRTSQYVMTRSLKVYLKVNLNTLVSKSGRRSVIKLLKAAHKGLLPKS